MSYTCRGCGEAEGIANIEPTVRYATKIRLENGELTAVLGPAVENDDGSYDSFAWQCQLCGTEGYTLETVVTRD